MVFATKIGLKKISKQVRQLEDTISGLPESNILFTIFF